MRGDVLSSWRLPAAYPADRDGRADYEKRVRRWQRTLYLPMILLIVVPAAIGWYAGQRIAQDVLWRHAEQSVNHAPRPPAPDIPAER